ncbi:hypothetical protein M406DRAFT_354579 [Cryphonectria parasitica EP155]|uniref:MARVEL domain-containing protein n=1 Tax=Cryphonectria parasitica (strain ATCC 38755 / EP155) TaxID=660469 RepID=A0A9P5CVP5_CRYP1|nr:uncharacterized protein M406DRAFT_354579 [Cryphonectria parasitica EP155]KAF3770825.1 hypothetical protein M406DRAFT_354579 [Cryphonectria parasitica EP155]
MVEFNKDKIPTYKLIVHIAQIVLSVTIWCLEIVVFKGGDVNGQMGWTFGVCFLSVPAWIYLIMAPRYPRASNIAQPNALLTVDALMTIIWLSAFATQAAYNTADDCGSACGVSKAIVGLGVFETLFWGLSTFISFATLQYYNTNGVLPGYDSLHRGRTHTMNDIDPDKAAFSTAPVDEEAYAPLGGGLHDHDDSMEPEFNAGPYGGGSSMHNDPDSFGTSHHQDTSYGGAGMGARYDEPVGAYESHGANTAYESHGSVGPGGAALYSPPQVHDEDYDSPAQFPAGNYDNIGFRQV